MHSLKDLILQGQFCLRYYLNVYSVSKSRVMVLLKLVCFGYVIFLHSFRHIMNDNQSTHDTPIKQYTRIFIIDVISNIYFKAEIKMK